MSLVERQNKNKIVFVWSHNKNGRRIELKGGIRQVQVYTVVIVESRGYIFTGIAVGGVADNQTGFAHSTITNEDALDSTPVVAR